MATLGFYNNGHPSSDDNHEDHSNDESSHSHPTGPPNDDNHNNNNNNHVDNDNNYNNDSKDNDQLEQKTDTPQEQAPLSMPVGNIDISKIDKDERSLRIYLDGVFDMTHYGHFRLFKSVKDKFPNAYIIVGVSGDEETIRLKGQTLMNESERAESVSHCKWVDEVICPCPWIVTQEFVDKQNIDYVAHDGLPYVSAGASDIYDFVKKQGKFIATERTEGISTTGLINRIVRRYNEFVLRNIKRGVKREDLNVSWTRQKRIELGEMVKRRSDELLDNVTTWIHDPNTFVGDFIDTFGPRGRIYNKVKEDVEKFKQNFVEYAQHAPM